MRFNMKVHNATLLASIIFFLTGLFLWIKYDQTTKAFSLAGNFITTGLFIFIIYVMLKIKK